MTVPMLYVTSKDYVFYTWEFAPSTPLTCFAPPCPAFDNRQFLLRLCELKAR